MSPGGYPRHYPSDYHRGYGNNFRPLDYPGEFINRDDPRRRFSDINSFRDQGYLSDRSRGYLRDRNGAHPHSYDHGYRRDFDHRGVIPLDDYPPAFP